MLGKDLSRCLSLPLFPPLSLSRSVSLTYERNTPQDVYDYFRMEARQVALDATGFVELLQTEKDAKGLEYAFRHDCEGCLKDIFWEHEGAREVWAGRKDSNVVLFDTKAGTNRYIS